ncbi:MAG: hypothetical protein GU357_00440 [Thermofilum sp.]|jgi:hypothetical protein|nr:hypothetical protein [Thermofilum sp.]
MAGSAVSLGGWLDQYAEVILTDLELAAELYFDFRSDGDPAKLMQSLYHAQQAVEKSFKLIAVAMGLFEEEKLKKELGHYPVIKTLQMLVDETQKLIKELDRSGQKQHLAWMGHAERFLGNQGEELKSLLNFLKKASCFEKVSRALNLDISLGKKAPKELEKIFESLENERGQSPNMVNIYEAVQAQVVSYWLWLKFMVELYGKTSSVKEVLEKRDPLTSEDLAQILSGIKKQSLQFYQQSLRMIWENPMESLKQLADIMPSVIENTRKTMENPENLYKFLVDVVISLKDEKVPDALKIRIKTIVTIAFLALGIPQMADGKTLIDHILCLDVFSECGRYVEPRNGKTNMDLVAEKQDVAAFLIWSAQLWVILLYAWYNFLKSLEKEAKKS